MTSNANIIDLSPTAYEQARARIERQKPTLPRSRRRREGGVKGEVSPRPWRVTVTPSGRSAVVYGADGGLVCACDAANAKAICAAVNGKEVAE